MTTEQQEQFRKEFKSIVYQYSELKSSEIRLKQLHNWDKKGSHDKAILKELEVRNSIQIKLINLLKGYDYYEWKNFSKNLSLLTSRLKNANIQVKKTELLIEDLKFNL